MKPILLVLLQAERLVKGPNYLEITLASNKKTQSWKAVEKNEAKAYLIFGLVHFIHTRSVSCKSDVITHHLLSNHIDILGITKTWLTSKNGDDIYCNICPDGFAAFHKPRLDTVGGGVALLFRDSIRDDCSSPAIFEATSFEYLATSLMINSICVRVVVIYRSTRVSFQCFLQEFTDFLERLVVLPGRLLIVDDFNIYVDNSADLSAKKILSTDEAHGLYQHVRESTHIKGHILDLVLTTSSDNMIAHCKVRG